MKYSLVWGASFKRAFKKGTRRNKELGELIYETLERLSDNPFDPSLDTHKLHGKLEGFWACTVGYDCRIVFLFERDAPSKKDHIVLFDIGTHDEVY